MSQNLLTFETGILNIYHRIMLNDLQASGRMIGVISHVPELKERIDIRLDLIAGRDGSKIKLVTP